MHLTTFYRVKYYVRHPWHIETCYKYFEDMDDATCFLRETRVASPQDFVNCPTPPCVECVGAIVDGERRYCLGSPIEESQMVMKKNDDGDDVIE